MTRQEKGLWATVIVLTAGVIFMGSWMLFSGGGSTEGIKQFKGTSPAVASVQDKAITEDEWVGELKKRYGRDVLMTMLNRRAVALEASGRGLDISEAELEAEFERMSRSYGSKERFIAEMESQLGIPEEELRHETVYRLLLEKIATADIEIDQHQIDEYLKLHPDQYRPKKQVDISVIEVATLDEAEQVLDRLEHGENFADLAQEVSIDEYTRDYGGRIGLVEEDDPFQSQALLETATLLEAGDIAGPIRLEDTYGIVYVHDVIEPPTLSEESIREAVRKQLALQQAVSLSELEQQLREKYEAKIFAGVLP
ncbi:peptidyl-prolyl cis-trans isomerase [Paenibacillus campinasensis]|uniref:peptidylprolyl isomerase n=1 Tax=Paenibacillus campinasensis TaxID=66347 RepID=A0A268EGI4_9BACL|nr:peptidyl-prolyl cis-trans isomerase [Paenibacillus campinasensis]PAD72247.1 peptidylprolyl isomerase [Paenibacillus campinasensis]